MVELKRSTTAPTCPLPIPTTSWIISSLFLNCYHVKDWLKSGPEWHDDLAPKLKKMAIEQFVTESPALCICADLCNRNKHFQLDKAPRSGSVPAFHRVHSRVEITAEGPLKTNRYTFRTQRGVEDAYTLAKECLESWRKFIFYDSTPETLRDLANRNSKNKPDPACLA